MAHPYRPWCVVFVLGLVVCQAHAATIRVPSLSINTIQEGIDAASDGDRVVVATGTYQESINSKGKTITVQSTDPEDTEVVAKTVISGVGLTSVVTLNGAEGPDAVLDGLTITGGVGNPIFYPGGIGARAGGGVYCGPLASPAIRHNHIHHNQANTLGAGVFCAGDVTLEENRIADNNGAGFGGGVYWSGSGGSIVGNRVICPPVFRTERWIGFRPTHLSRQRLDGSPRHQWRAHTCPQARVRPGRAHHRGAAPQQRRNGPGRGALHAG